MRLQSFLAFMGCHNSASRTPTSSLLLHTGQHSTLSPINQPWVPKSFDVRPCLTVHLATTLHEALRSLRYSVLQVGCAKVAEHILSKPTHGGSSWQQIAISTASECTDQGALQATTLFRCPKFSVIDAMSRQSLVASQAEPPGNLVPH